jgi:tRNA threonylcarbamoyladenosine biosynthesis protein TsaB
VKSLIIDTSSSAASAALFEDGNIIGEVFVNDKATHSQKLMPIVHDLLTQMHTKISDIDAYYVCEGPGSFTGVRIGIATVKGFAQPFNKPVYTFPSMFLIASGAKHHEGLIVPVIDAKREEVYYGVYSWDDGFLSTLEEGVESLEQLLTYLEEKYPGQNMLLLGDAITAYPNVFENHETFLLGSSTEGVPKASDLAIASLAVDESSTVYSAKANYMRKSQAERDR